MSRGDFEKLHRELGAEHMQIRQHEGRVDVSFTDRTGTERTWSRGGTERTISVHDYELGRDRGAPAPRQPERTSPTRTETRAAGPPARESRTPAREPVREPRTHDPKAPRERPEREGRSAGPTTNGSPPRRPPVSYPPGFSPEATVRLGEEMRQRFARDPIGKYLWFFDAVRTGGQMDLKKYGKTKEEKERFAPAGNYNYGLLGRALGIPDEVLRSGAGAWQLVDAARRWASGGRFTYRAEWGVPFFSDSRGDDPVDQHWIRRGVRDYELGIGTPLEPPPPLLEPHDPALPRIY
ncbi:MAG TPA: polymorphic toxin type 44 domain-containing protein [Labilithrix sp.]|nr:polymorphic toxin type 44 domain-containing protein [Labilithrix sp.]